jgi:hypothetical protein
MSEFADRNALFAVEPCEDRAPGGIGQRREGAVEGAAVRDVNILNHMVKY